MVKRFEIGQSAAKRLRNKMKVQRLDRVTFGENKGEISTNAWIILAEE
jgi:hypothetical protein